MEPSHQRADCVVFSLDGQCCGLPIPTVRDVLDRVVVTPVPLAPPAMAGHLNLRGRIVTAIDLAERIGGGGIPSNDNGAPRRTAIVVEHAAALYALLVDDVSEVLPIEPDAVTPIPAGLPAAWTALATGVVRRPDGLLVLLDPERILAIGENAA